MLTEPAFVSATSITHGRAAVGPPAQDGCGDGMGLLEPIPVLSPSSAQRYGHGHAPLWSRSNTYLPGMRRDTGNTIHYGLSTDLRTKCSFQIFSEMDIF